MKLKAIAKSLVTADGLFKQMGVEASNGIRWIRKFHQTLDHVDKILDEHETKDLLDTLDKLDRMLVKLERDIS